MSTFYMGIVVPSVVVLPLGVALARIRRWQVSEQLVFCYLLLSAVFNIIAKLLAQQQVNNMPALHLYTILEFCLLSAVFRSFFTERILRQLLAALMLLFPLCAVLYIGLSDSLYTYNVGPRFLSSFLITAMCLYFVGQDLRDIRKGQSMFRFTVVMGLLVYFSGSSALFGLSELIKGNRPLNTLLWNAHATLVMILYFVIAAAYLILPPRP